MEVQGELVDRALLLPPPLGPAAAAALRADPSPRRAAALLTLLGTGVLGGLSATGFDRVTTVDPLLFPRDHGGHPGHALEWVFLWGGGRLEFEGRLAEVSYIVLFLFRRVAPHLSWTLVEVQQAVSVEGGPHVVARPRLSWTRRPLHLVPGGRRVEVASGDDTEPGPFLRGRIGARGRLEGVRLRPPASDRLQVDLEAACTRPPFLHGGTGTVGHPEIGVAYRYYSCVHMPTEGRISLLGRSYRLFDGISWFDHEWGTIGPATTLPARVLFALSEAAGAPFRRLDRGYGLFVYEHWFALHLDDGTSVNLVWSDLLPRSLDEAVPMTAWRMSPEGRLEELSGVTMEVTRWRRGDEGPLPEGFVFRGVGPAGSLVGRPLVADQRLEWAGGGHVYEGGLVLEDAAGRVVGRGFAEAVGWDEHVAGEVLARLGLPADLAAVADRPRNAPGRLALGGALALVAGLVLTWMRRRRRSARGRG